MGGRDFACGGCDRRFRTEAATAQHARAKGRGHYVYYGSESESEESESFFPPLPFPGADGEWVDTSDFEGVKSFGCFVCDCNAWWMSAHAWKHYGQDCKTCGDRNRAMYMWVNTFARPVDRDRDGPSDGPHMRDLCEACAAGVCMVSRHAEELRRGPHIFPPPFNSASLWLRKRRETRVF